MYSIQEANQLVEQAIGLGIKLYPTTEIYEIETLIKHKLLDTYDKDLISEILTKIA